MSEEQSWLIALSMDQLGQACKAAGVKVDGFRHLSLVPRLLLERQILTLLTRHRGQSRSAKLRSALAKAWRERYPTLAGVVKSGLPAAPDDDRPELERWGEWLAGLGRTFGRAPVQMGVQLTDLPLPQWADGEFLAQLETYWSADAPLMPALASPDTAEPVSGTEEEEEPLVETRPDWRQERGQFRARLRSLTQENQLLQRARTSAEHRAAHYQAQVEQVRAEMEGLANRTDWPHPTMLVQRLIRGLMEARRQILDLELANAELRTALAQGPEPEAEPEDEPENQ